MSVSQPYKKLYRTFFPLLVVIALQGIVTLAVNLADNIMLGAYNETALSGAALVNQVHFILQSLVSGVGTGLAALTTQYWGKRETAPIRSIISLGLKFSLAFGVIFWALGLTIPNQILSLFTRDAAVIAEGAKYMRLMAWTYLLFSASNVLVVSLQSVQTAWIGTVMSACTLCVNIFLNYIFIYGNFGAPELGIRGAAVATLTSRVIELAAILFYILKVDKKLKIKLRQLLAFDFEYLRDFLRTALPVVLAGAQWGVAQAAQTAILGHVVTETITSDSIIAANSIASVVMQLFTVFGFACSNAAQVTIGKTVGEGDISAVKRYSKRLQLIFLIVGVLTGIGIFSFKGLIVSLYSVSPVTANLAVQFLTVLAVTTIGTCYEFPVEGGIIAGGGNTAYQGWVDILFMWLFTIPSAAISAFVFGFPPVVTFAFLKADQILKCVPNAIVCNRFKWVRILTR